ncbi:MAG: hypothetical protein COA47_07585 [Robiginitomaculum sp.]|nr:MAG: hypothetical protein COA47_07585 [Robiginitomaculum sp.]
MRSILLALGIIFCCSNIVLAEPDPTETKSLYVIFDVSNSMWGELSDGTRKIEAARQAFHNIDGKLMANRELALRLYGHRTKSDCEDTQLVVPFGSPVTTLPKMRSLIDSVQPLGKTPIARSLELALADMKGRTGEVLLISDGVESCGRDPCALVKNWKSSGIELVIHVVGLGLDRPGRTAMQCITDTAGGSFYDSRSASDLSANLQKTTSAELGVGRVFPVRVFAQLFPKGSNARLVLPFVAMQNGKDIGMIQYAGGGTIPSGTYTLEVRNSFTPFRVENVEISNQQTQTLRYEVPVGWFEMDYVFKTEPKTKSRVGRLYRLDGSGKPGTDKIKIKPGQNLPLAAGRYRLVAWQPRGDFDPIDFTITLGQTTKAVLTEN